MPKLGIKPGFIKLVGVRTEIRRQPPVQKPPIVQKQAEYISNKRSDGVGSQLLAKISTMLYARHNNLVYVHTPFRRSKRHSNTTPEPDVIERFFNLGFGELHSPIQDCKIVSTPNFFAKNPDVYNQIMPTIKKRYNLSLKECSYNTNILNIALHIRRGDVVSHNSKRYTSNAIYLNIIRRLDKLNLPPHQFHVFSEGRKEEFSDFRDVALLHLNGDALDTFHHLVKSDIFVMAKSSFSYSAALYSGGVIIYHHTCGFGCGEHYRPMSNWISSDSDFKLLYQRYDMPKI